MTVKSNISFIKTLVFTGLALFAFAANSVLCRLALGEEAIDWSGFTVLRLLSGVIVLMLILQIMTRKKKSTSSGSWPAALMLFIYAGTFSFAYITLDTGTGALVLFGAVQLTMIIGALVNGERLRIIAWSGVMIAFAGFIYLVLPGVTTPSVVGFLFMTIAGIAWGFYTLMGKGSANPLADTAFNFTRTIPFVIILAIFAIPYLELSVRGIILAVISGAIASGIGYTIWYTALRGLSSTQAAVVQLLVPVIAAIGGIVFISESMTFHLIISSFMILGGVTLVLIRS